MIFVTSIFVFISILISISFYMKKRKVVLSYLRITDQFGNFFFAEEVKKEYNSKKIALNEFNKMRGLNQIKSAKIMDTNGSVIMTII